MRKQWLGLILGVLFPLAAFAQDDLAAATQLYRQGKLAQAKTAFEAMVRKNPRQAEPHYYLGRIAFQQSDLDRAIDQLEEAVELRPASADYHYWLGRAYGQQALKANIFKKMGLAT